MNLDNNLDKNVLEYIKSCIRLGLINDNNKDYVLNRLNKTKIEYIENAPYGGRTYQEDGKIIVEICLDTLKREAKELKKEENEYINENIYHELTHACSLTDEEIEKKIQKIIEEPNEYKFISEQGYSIVSEFIAQSLAQKIMEEKSDNKNLYTPETKTFIYNENGHLNDSYSYEYTSNLVWYGEVEKFAKNFIESIYGEDNFEQVYIDNFNGNVIEKAIEIYSTKEDGLHDLYKLFGDMSNIIVGDYYQLGYYGPDRHESWSNINIFKNSINEFNELIEKHTKTNIPKK